MSARHTTGRRALLLIDFQYDFLTGDGRMPIAAHQTAELIRAANRAVAAARERGDIIVAVGNEFSPSDRFMNLLRRNAALAGSRGAAWDDRVDSTGAAYFAKSRSDAFSNDRLGPYLADHAVDEVVLTGVMAKACVSATARGALRRGLRVCLLAPAIGDTSDRAKRQALEKLAALPGACRIDAYDDGWLATAS